jgi:hypothetical protein
VRTAQLWVNTRIRETPFTSRVEAAGVQAYSVNNHMLLPLVFRSVEDDDWQRHDRSERLDSRNGAHGAYSGTRLSSRGGRSALSGRNRSMIGGGALPSTPGDA